MQTIVHVNLKKLLLLHPFSRFLPLMWYCKHCDFPSTFWREPLFKMQGNTWICFLLRYLCDCVQLLIFMHILFAIKGEFYRDFIPIWWRWISVLLHYLLCWAGGHSVWQCQLLQVWIPKSQTLFSLNANKLINCLHLLASFRCYCKDCLNMLVGPGTFDKLTEVDPWSCYICLPPNKYGVLKLRPDWSVRVQEFFANNSAFEFVSSK